MVSALCKHWQSQCHPAEVPVSVTCRCDGALSARPNCAVHIGTWGLIRASASYTPGTLPQQAETEARSNCLRQAEFSAHPFCVTSHK